MYFEAELVCKSYIPDELELGMYFLNYITVGILEPYPELWELKEIPEDMDKFMSINGCPVNLYIVDDEDNELATPDEIAYFDKGDEYETLDIITLKEINIIFQEYDGWLDLEIDEHYYENYNEIVAFIYDDMATIRYLQEEIEEE